MRDTCRLPFVKALRDQGFTRCDNGREPLHYELRVGCRRLLAQLWKDGDHRMTHWVHFDQHRASMCTEPTGIRSPADVAHAMAHELARADHLPHVREWLALNETSP